MTHGSKSRRVFMKIGSAKLGGLETRSVSSLANLEQVWPHVFESADGYALQNPNYLRRAGPETFQAKELPLLGPEYVDDHVAAVQEHPARIGTAFPSVDGLIGLFQSGDDVLFQGLDQPGRVCGHDDEIVGERGQSSQIQHDDVSREFLGCDFNDKLRDFRWFQFLGRQITPPTYNSSK